MNKMGQAKIADDINYEDYDKVKIDSFGKKMLFKMGWNETKPVKEGGPVKPFEFKSRANRLGLGAEPLNLEDDKKMKKPSDKKNKKSFYGTKIKITAGKHKGLKGKIVEKDIENLEKYLRENKYVNVELKVNKQIVKEKCEFIRIRSIDENKLQRSEESDSKRNMEKENSNFQSKKIQSRSLSKSRSRSRSRLRKNGDFKKPLKWVIPHILVRIISKKSKYYNTKANIEDLIDLYTFSLITSDNTVHTTFKEKDIETVIPTVNSDVVILKGPNKGEYAKLLERDKKNNKVAVQLNNDLSIVNFTQDDICALTPN